MHDNSHTAQQVYFVEIQLKDFFEYIPKAVQLLMSHLEYWEVVTIRSPSLYTPFLISKQLSI